MQEPFFTKFQYHIIGIFEHRGHKLGFEHLLTTIDDDGYTREDYKLTFDNEFTCEISVRYHVYKNKLDKSIRPHNFSGELANKAAFEKTLYDAVMLFNT